MASTRYTLVFFNNVLKNSQIDKIFRGEKIISPQTKPLRNENKNTVDKEKEKLKITNYTLISKRKPKTREWKKTARDRGLKNRIEREQAKKQAAINRYRRTINTKKTSLNRLNAEKLTAEAEAVARQIRHQPALIHIGKNGITENIVIELKNLIERNLAVKIQILRNSPIDEPNVQLKDIEKQTDTKLWRSAGRVGIFIITKDFKIE